MKLKKIFYFLNLIKPADDAQYYTFKKAEHELVLLKKLEDEKIFYNDTLYEKDFFYYHKLDEFIQKNFTWYFTFKRSSTNLKFPIIKYFEFDPNNSDEIPYLTKYQYDILVKAYKYEFAYPLVDDLLDPEKSHIDAV